MQVKFYWEQNEDDSPRDSISDSSKKLLLSGGGKVIYWPYILRDFSEGGTSCHTQHSWQRLATSHEEQMKQIILVLF